MPLIIGYWTAMVGGNGPLLGELTPPIFNVTGSAEGFMSYIGGSRSFPVCTIMDDRRHRLIKLDKGSSAQYGLKEWGEQFLIHKDGIYATGNTELMKRLGYDRFVASGGDWGALITDQMGVQAPPELIGIHTNMAGAIPPQVDAAAFAGGRE